MGKVYPQEFRDKAVELYRLGEKTTVRDVAEDMGCSTDRGRAQLGVMGQAGRHR